MFYYSFMKKFLLFLIFSCAYSISSVVWYESSISYSHIILPEKETFLTSEELKWLSNHRVIRMAPDPQFAPFEFIDKDGKYQGIGADYLFLIEDILDIKFEILIYSNWSDIIADFKAKKIDLLNAVISNDLRNEYMIFPEPYIFIPSVIVGRKDEVKNVSLDNLGKYRIVVVKDYGLTGYFTQKYKGYKTTLVNNNIEALELLIKKEADVFIADLATAEYYMRRGGYVNLEIVGVFKPDSVMGFGVRKDWKIFKDILDKTQKKIPPQVHTYILNKWIKIDLYNKKILERVLIISIIVFLSIIITVFILLFFNYQLNQIIKRRTFELNLELEKTKKLEVELKKSADFLDEILNELPVPVLMASEDLKVLKSNIALKNFANITPEEISKMEDDLIKRLDFVYSEETKNFIIENMKDFLKSSTKEINLDSIKLKLKNGEERICDIKVKKIEKNIVFTFVDLTEILKLQEALKSSLKEKDLLIKEIHHRVKNNFNIVISLLNLQKNKTTNENIKDSLTVSQNRIYSMALIHEMLYQTNQYTSVNFSIYIEKLINYLKGIYPEIFDKVKFDISIENIPELSMDIAIPCGMIVNEILTNSLKYAFPEKSKGNIKIDIKEKDKILMIEIGDNGIGVKDRKSFFEGNSLGITIIKSLIYQLKASIEIKNEKGLFYLINIPLNLSE